MLQNLILYIKKLFLKYALHIFLSLFTVQWVCACCQGEVLQQWADVLGIWTQVLQELDDHLHEVCRLREYLLGRLYELFLVLWVLESFLLEAVVVALGSELVAQAIELVERQCSKVFIVNILFVLICLWIIYVINIALSVLFANFGQTGLVLWTIWFRSVLMLVNDALLQVID